MLFRRLHWLACNAGLFALTYLWLVFTRDWAGNLLKFYSGLTLLAGLVSFTDAAQETAKKFGPSGPPWLSQIHSVTLAFVFASQAHFVLASIFIFEAISISVLFSKWNEEKKEGV